MAGLRLDELHNDSTTVSFFGAYLNAAMERRMLGQPYKRQPTIEKRFSQLKTDFEVAPIYLEAVHRIQALRAVYFFALLREALLERAP